MAAPMYPPAGAPGMGMPGPMATMAPTRDEISGASKIKWGAALGVIGLVMAIAGVLIVLFDVGLGVSNLNSSSSHDTLLKTVLLAVSIIVAGVFVALLSFVLYTLGFASLRKADKKFGVPMILCVIGIVGLLCLGAFVGLYALSINTAIACNPNDLACQNNATGNITGGAALLYLGGFLGFLGLIGGILGLWRFGSRYDSTVTKVGTILYIIPFLAIVAPFLVLIGAHMVQKKLRSGTGTMAPPPMPPMAPAPPPSM